MKKITALVLSIILLFVFTAGCRSNEGEPASTDKATSAPDSGKTVNGKDKEIEKDPFGAGFTGYPMSVDESLRFWTNALAPHPEYVDASDSPFHQWISEFTGVNIIWERPAAGADGTQAYNLMLASDDLPDLIYTYSLPAQGENLLYEKTIISLDDYIQEYAPNLYRRLKENHELDLAVKTDSGHYYTFPFIREDVAYLGTWQGPAIRKDYLEQLGLGEPVTISDWDEILHKFKDICDTPLSVYSGTQLLQWFGNAYGFYYGYFVEDQQVNVWYNAEGYYDFLVQMKKWYDDGLIDPDFITMDMTGLVSKVAGNSVGSVFMGSGTVARFKPALEENGFDYNIIPASYPVMNEGDIIKFPQGEAAWIGTGAVITTNCKNIPLAMRFLDYGYTDEGVITYNFGKEGVSFNFVDGVPTFTELVTASSEGTTTAIQRYSPMTANAPSIMLVEFYNQKTDPLGIASVEKWIENTDGVPYRMPPISATVDEITELSDLETTINTYATEMYYNFILGTESLDNFDDYIGNLKSMNVDRILQIKTEQLQRYFAR